MNRMAGVSMKLATIRDMTMMQAPSMAVEAKPIFLPRIGTNMAEKKQMVVRHVFFFLLLFQMKREEKWQEKCVFSDWESST